MKASIVSSAVISPQPTHGSERFPSEAINVVTDRLSCIEPDYRELINPLLLRRMPRILKMGLAASQLCMKRSGISQPDGIIVGTGLGCLDNLEKFLMEMIDHDERITTVLPFINSTHNAVAGQISMMLKNHSYSTTYCHKGFSFESALRDALMLVTENSNSNVLVGGIDECTTDFMLLHSYLDAWKKPLHNMKLFSETSPGTIAGEGAAFFIVSGKPGPVNVEGIHTFLTGKNPAPESVAGEIEHFLGLSGMSFSDVDVIMAGLNGDADGDRVYHELIKKFPGKPVTCWKHLCGEYYTSSAFALWLATEMLGSGAIPGYAIYRNHDIRSFSNILIYNHTGSTGHACMLLKKF